MFISQIKLNADLKSAKRALSSPQIMHAIIERCFDSSEQKLWRLDGEKLLIVSTKPPSEPEAALQLSTDLPMTKDYGPYLASIKKGKVYRFRLTANPVHSVPLGPGKRGKVMAHVTIEQQMEWLREKSKKLGFTPHEFTITASSFLKFHKKGHEVTIKLATYDGLLTVTDNNLLIKAMTEGIGRAKAYGAGLLTLMP